ncbi:MULTISPECIES: LysE family translocator [unclassified Mesorhizobium]|uniref:LysE family translocator n=1 Tax=unclassified Mesorhizobium TaxID=325217 RepID=UPI002859A763|nr:MULTISPECIES: LysE family translocator [unclassified Mesorhizobium]MDR7035108.1 threonine/homoserine/homoserine lactone efflux protein [Mesorhizobium sp. BE184]
MITALLVELTPGPNMTYLALVSASNGRRAGLATVAGIAIGLATIGLIAALGVAEIIQASAIVYEMLRWSGVIFLLYLAWEGWISGTDVVASAPTEHGRYFTRGLITNLLNPKAGVFYISVLPTFIDPTVSATRQAMILTAVYVTVATLIHLVIVLLAGSLEPVLNDPGRERLARRFFSLLLAAVALWFAWTTAR